MNTRVHLEHKKILKVLLKDGRFLHIFTIKDITICTRLAIFWFFEEKGHWISVYVKNLETDSYVTIEAV